MSDKLERLEAEIKMEKAAAAFRAAKERRDEDPVTYLETKATLSEARRDWRENHRVAPSGPGDGTARPAVVKTKGTVD